MTYAMYDTTVRPSNPGYGFSNAKRALAFSFREDRDAFVANRESYDFSAIKISRREAMKMLEPIYGGPDMGLWLDGPPENPSTKMITLRSSKL